MLVVRNTQKKNSHHTVHMQAIKDIQFSTA